jgi:gliding motility-associated protein GldC
MNKNEINITVTLDDNKIPEAIEWSAADTDGQKSGKAMMLALWDGEAQNTLHIDLWTKKMMVDEMKQFCYQNLVSMADTLERATGEKDAAKAMRNFAKDFGEKMKVLATGPTGSAVNYR